MLLLLLPPAVIILVHTHTFLSFLEHTPHNIIFSLNIYIIEQIAQNEMMGRGIISILSKKTCSVPYNMHDYTGGSNSVLTGTSMKC